MKSITIHNLDDTTEALIKEKARKEGLSLNRVIKKLLRQSLGLGTEVEVDRRDQFKDLCGVWSKKDHDQIMQKISVLRQIDTKDW